MKPKYLLFKSRSYSLGEMPIIIKRLSGGTKHSRYTVTKYELIYPDPEEIDEKTKRVIDRDIRGDGRSTGKTLYKKDSFCDTQNCLIKKIFEKVPNA
jgi:hypothetical protein